MTSSYRTPSRTTSAPEWSWYRFLNGALRVFLVTTAVMAVVRYGYVVGEAIAGLPGSAASRAAAGAGLITLILATVYVSRGALKRFALRPQSDSVCGPPFSFRTQRDVAQEDRERLARHVAAHMVAAIRSGMPVGEVGVARAMPIRGIAGRTRGVYAELLQSGETFGYRPDPSTSPLVLPPMGWWDQAVVTVAGNVYDKRADELCVLASDHTANLAGLGSLDDTDYARSIADMLHRYRADVPGAGSVSTILTAVEEEAFRLVRDNDDLIETIAVEIIDRVPSADPNLELPADESDWERRRRVGGMLDRPDRTALIDMISQRS